MIDRVLADRHDVDVAELQVHGHRLQRAVALPPGLERHACPGGDISVAAESTATIGAQVVALAGSVSIGGVAVSASIGVGIARNNIGYVPQGADPAPEYDPLIVTAFLENTGVSTFGKLSVDATSSEAISANVITGSVAIAVGVVGVAARYM